MNASFIIMINVDSISHFRLFNLLKTTIYHNILEFYDFNHLVMKANT